MRTAIQRYLRHHRIWETLMWISFLITNWVVNVWIIWVDMDRLGSEYARWEPAVWEATSALMIGLLLPLILKFNHYFPIQRGRLRRSLPAHFIMSVIFLILHVSGMVGLRKLIYGAVDRSYDFGPWVGELLYEFSKDFRTYLSIIAAVYLYQFILRRLQGEAEFLQQGREEADPEPVTDRFLVKKLGREFLVKVDDIDWIEAAGNYANLHIGNRLYPLRDTMTAIEARLNNQGFIRVHRSAIVNMDRVAEIVPFDTGDAEIRLTTQATVPVSRSYRKQLKDRLS